KKGSLAPGQLADLAVLSDDFFGVRDEDIKRLESVLTLVGGKIVYAAEEFVGLAPAPLPVAPDWSPVKEYDGYHRPQGAHADNCVRPGGLHALLHRILPSCNPTHEEPFWGAGCECFAF